jgi:DNA primase
VIPQGFIQDLLARVDIVDVIGRYVQLKKAGQSYKGLCPFHNEKTPSFNVSPGKQLYHCFGCGVGGSAITFLMEHRGLPYVEAIRELAQQVGMQVPEDAQGVSVGAGKAGALTQVLQQAADFYRQQLKVAPGAIAYLKGRGIEGKTAARFALGYAPDDWQALRRAFDPYEDVRLVEAGLVIADEGKRYDRFRGRVMFPIRNRRGAVIGFGARVIEGGEPKYLNSPETAVFRKGQELYGLYEAFDAIRTRKRAIVCEGYMDVIQLAQAGFEESVAALGTAITSVHVATLLRLTDQVFFAFDGDAAGRKAARRALEAALPVIGDTQRAHFVLLPEGEDPDSLIQAQGDAAFEDQLAAALPLSRWFVQCLAEGKDLDAPEGRAAMLAEAKPLLASMPPGALRLQLVAELATAGRTASDQIEALFELKPWRRLPTPRPAGGARQLPVEDLKSRLVQHLVACPELAREFNAQIATECLDGQQPEDRQIVELWRAATMSVGSTPSTAALLETLAESEFFERYRELAARDGEADPEAARADLRAAFATLTLRRIEIELQDLAALVAKEGLTPETRERYSQLREQQAKLKGAAPAVDPG